MTLFKHTEPPKEIESLQRQIDKLADYILKYYPDEINEGGAIDVAIRIMQKTLDRLTEFNQFIVVNNFQLVRDPSDDNYSKWYSDHTVFYTFKELYELYLKNNQKNERPADQP